MSIHNLGFRILGYYHRAQWRGAKTASKECSGRCHGLIPNLWDFAQNYSLQIELRNQNWRRTFHSLDSDKAIELCISNVEKAQYAEFHVPTCEHPLKPPMFDSLYRRSWDAKTLQRDGKSQKRCPIPDCLLFQSFCQFWSQTRKPRIPDEEFQSDTPWSQKTQKFKKRREISNVGWSQELTEVFGGHSCGKIAVWQLCRDR